ncbi:MAG: ABC transporter permease subunit [Symbiopectobacterium sp.]
MFGIALGAVMAVWEGKWPDRVLSMFALLLYSTPGFWIGLMTLILFSVQLDWLPSGKQHHHRCRSHWLGLRRGYAVSRYFASAGIKQLFHCDLRS